MPEDIFRCDLVAISVLTEYLLFSALKLSHLHNQLYLSIVWERFPTINTTEAWHNYNSKPDKEQVYRDSVSVDPTLTTDSLTLTSY